MREEKPITRTVRNLWGSWDGLYAQTKNLMRVARKNNSEIGSNQFKKELIGHMQMSRDEYRLAVRAVNMTIRKIDQEEREARKEQKEKRESVVTKEMIAGARKKEWRDIKASGGKENYDKMIFR